jgi:hypothetical protein
VVAGSGSWYWLHFIVVCVAGLWRWREAGRSVVLVGSVTGHGVISWCLVGGVGRIEVGSVFTTAMRGRCVDNCWWWGRWCVAIEHRCRLQVVVMREGSVGGLRRCHVRSQGRRVDFGQWVHIVLCGRRAICVLRYFGWSGWCL